MTIGVSAEFKDGDFYLIFNPVYKSHMPSTNRYCIQLKGTEDAQSVGQHNLPPFMPVKHLEEMYLGNNLLFLGGEDQMSLYFNSFMPTDSK